MQFDFPASDRLVRYTAAGGETIFDVDWRVETPTALLVERVRNDRMAQLEVGLDFEVRNVGVPSGAQVRLAVPAVRGDILTMAELDVILTGDQAGLPYGLGEFVGDWSFGRHYLRGQGVLNGGSSYVSTGPHISNSANSPGMGPQWRSVWRLVASGVGTSQVQDKQVTLAKLSDTLVEFMAGASGPDLVEQRGWRDWINTPRLTGVLTTTLSKGVVGRIDYKSRIGVSVTGTLRTIAQEELLNGGNQIAVFSSGTRFELIQFKVATPGAVANNFTLPELLRGQGGTGSLQQDEVAPPQIVLFR